MLSADAIDEIKPEWRALLLQLLLHKQSSVARLRRATSRDRGALERDLGALERMGLVVARRPDVFELNRFLQHMVIDRFHRRGLLSG
jgi:predicted transcriptional regulator